jgi:hypothetical protein
MAVTMKSIVFWDVMPCSLVQVTRRFGGTYCLHLERRRERDQKVTSMKHAARRASLILNGSSLSLVLTLKMKAICISET